MSDQPDREAEPYFSQPVRQIATMLAVLGLVGAGGYLAYPSVAPVFLANPWLNGFILIVFIFGVFACFWQVLQLVSSVNWIEGFAAERLGHEIVKAPRLLAPLAALLRSRGARMQIGASSTASILDSVATRIDEARDITRYIVNLLIFLGLLGTFYGLAITVPAVVETIRSLEPTGDEGAIEVFGRLMGGLEKQLGGMGTAFGSSLLGLAGSLIVGLLELFASHGQNRFYRELEEWLSTFTRVGYSSGDVDGAGDSHQMTLVIDVMAEQMASIKGLFDRAEIRQSSLDDNIEKMTSKIGEMVAQQTVQSDNGIDKSETTKAISSVAESQQQLVEFLSEERENGGAHVDAESRMRLRSIDVQLLRILEELSAGRQESVTEMRTELARLTLAIRALGQLDES